MDSIAENAVKFELMEQSGIKKLKFRERNIFGEHDDHDDHGHGKKKKMITMTMITIKKLKKKIMMITMTMTTIKKLRKKIMMITDMTTMDTDMVSLIRTSG